MSGASGGKEEDKGATQGSHPPREAGAAGWALQPSRAREGQHPLLSAHVGPGAPGEEGKSSMAVHTEGADTQDRTDDKQVTFP